MHVSTPNHSTLQVSWFIFGLLLRWVLRPAQPHAALLKKLICKQRVFYYFCFILFSAWDTYNLLFFFSMSSRGFLFYQSCLGQHISFCFAFLDHFFQFKNVLLQIWLVFQCHYFFEDFLKNTSFFPFCRLDHFSLFFTYAICLLIIFNSRF